MKKHLIILISVICTITFGQVGINTDSPHPSSDLELASPDKALFLNRVANPESDISSPQNGMILYDTTKQCVRAYQGNAWSNCLGFSDEEPGSVTTLDCGSATHSGTMINDGTEYTSGIESTIPYTGGNGGHYPALAVSSTGVTGLTATLQAGTFNSGDGTLTFNITGTPSGEGNAVFNINIGGQNCSFARTVDTGTPPVGSVTTLDCNAKLDPTAIFVGQNYIGILKISYSGGNGGTYEADTFTVKGLTFTRNAGNFAVGNGEIIYNVSGVPGSTGSIVITELSIGGQSCTSLDVGVVTGFTLYCGSGSYQPVLNPDNLMAGQSYTGTYTIKYFTNSGGFYDGTAYPAESFTVNGLTFSRTAGTFVGGSVTDVTYNVSGNPISSGNMDITVSLAGETCTTTKNVNNAAPSGCTGNEYLIHSGQKAVKICGQIWMRHNLGVNSSLDPDTNPQSQALIGNYYLWGEKTAVANGYTDPGPISGYDTSWGPAGSPDPKLSVNNKSWNLGTETSPVKNSNDPCPNGFRVPTESEINALFNNSQNIIENYGDDWSTNSTNYNNAKVVKNGLVQLTFPAAGYRMPTYQGSLIFRGSRGRYYTSTTTTPSSNGLFYVKSMDFDENSWESNGYDAGNRGVNIKCIAQ